MVAIQGASGASPDGLPRASGDEEVNPEGVLPSGQTVSFTAVEKNESAAEVQQVALPIIQSDGLMSSPILGGAIGELEVADVVADVVEKNEANVQQVEEDLEAIFQAIASGEEQLESLEVNGKGSLKGLRRASDRKEGVAKNMRTGALSVRNRLVNTRSSLKRMAKGMRHHAGLVTSSLADLHKKLRGISQQDLLLELGKDGEAVLSQLKKLGLEIDAKGEWKLRSHGEVGRLHRSIYDLALLAERVHEGEPFDLDEAFSKEEANACCCAWKKAYQFCQEHLMSALRAVYQQILRFFRWISNKVGIHSKRTDYYTRPGVFTNPYASYLGSNPPLEDPRSLRDRLRDGAAEDSLFVMPQDESLDSESVSDDDRGWQ